MEIAMLQEFQRLDTLLDRTVLDPATWVGGVFYAVLLLVASLAVSRSLARAARHLAEHRGSAVDRTALAFFTRVGQFFVFAFALTFYAHIVPALDKLSTALLTGASLASIVIGLAAQNTLGNVISGFLLVLYRPFRAGDQISVMTPSGIQTGGVEDLTLGYTILRTYEHRRIVIPNSLLTNQTWINLTTVDPHLIAEVPVPIAYTADLDAAREVLLHVAEAEPRVQEVVGCPVSALGDSSVTLLLRVLCAHAADARAVTWALTEAAKQRLDAESIEIPFPYTNVVLHENTSSERDGGGSAPSPSSQPPP